MKNKLLTLALVALPGLALADFSLDFSSGDYSDGALAGNSDWALWNENGDTDVYSISNDQLIVDPADNFSGFSSATYRGDGYRLDSGSQLYSVDVDFTLNFTSGSAVRTSGASTLPQFDIKTIYGGVDNSASFAVRHDGNNSFNMVVGDKFNGSANNRFGGNFSGTDIGLTTFSGVDWDNGESIALLLSYSLTGNGSNSWAHDLTLRKKSDNTIVATLSHTGTDTDGSFSDGANNPNEFRFTPGGMQNEQVAANINSIQLSTVPEPSAYALLSGLLALAWVTARRQHIGE